LRGSKGVGVTIESYGKVEISYINVRKKEEENNNKKKRSKNNKSPNVVWET
jgi:pantoate kinase